MSRYACCYERRHRTWHWSVAGRWWEGELNCAVCLKVSRSGWIGNHAVVMRRSSGEVLIISSTSGWRLCKQVDEWGWGERFPINRALHCPAARTGGRKYLPTKLSVASRIMGDSSASDICWTGRTLTLEGTPPAVAFGLTVHLCIPYDCRYKYWFICVSFSKE